ncbi:MAG: GH36-type glycosyl hydrolase domain-containing protein [Pseudomonadota bacterium]
MSIQFQPILSRAKGLLRNISGTRGSGNDFIQPAQTWLPEVLSREGLEELATQLADSHRDAVSQFHSSRLLRSYRSNRAALKRVYLRLAEAAHNGEALTAGAEWLLDNYHLVERHAAQIKKYLPRSFYRILPKLTRGGLRGLPRIYHLAIECVVHTDGSINAERTSCFISSYQKRLELSSGELWAFPIMLRLALLESLRHLTEEAEQELLARREVFSLVDQVLGDESRTGTEIMVELARRINERESFLIHGALELLRRLRSRGRKAFMALQFLEEKLRERGLNPEDLLRAEDHRQATRQISVGNTLTSLNAVDQMNWRDWFESVSLCDSELRKDPGNLYRQNDFTSRDTLRQEIEKLAKALGRTDSQVAAKVVECAQDAARDWPGPENHARVQRYVGHFLFGEGRKKLEQRLGYSPPVLLSLQRFLFKHALAAYLGSILFLTTLFVGYVCLISEWVEASHLVVIAALLVAILPMSELASSLVQYLVSRWVKPRPLPKLQSDGPVPTESKTLVVVHTIFSSVSSIQRAIDGLEIRFLGNDDPAFTFVLMADLPDAASEHTPIDEQIIKVAADGIETLNRRHASGIGPRFLLFFRSRQWNPGEGVWMAWERKRGKIEELNRYLLGDKNTSLKLIVGATEQLEGVRYVITLDSDSQLARDVGKKLVATISHPMNRPMIDPIVNRVVKGYAFIQPRVTISLTSASSSFFSQLFSGQAGLDPYTNVVSEVYQDLFGEGSFWGKGIYDVQAFEKVLHNRVPENSLLSHDLFEGSFARVALASDVELYDDFPSRYMAYSKRLHRWVRGDWQLLPWLFPRVPTRTGRQRSQISWLSWWKMFDNLRRSLVPPACLAAILGGWLFLPGGPLTWTAIVLIVIAFPVFTGLAAVFALPSVGISIGGFLGDIGRDLWRNTVRSFLGVAFLPHQAALMLHAIGVTLGRVCCSRRHLLEWEPAERAERRSKNERADYLKLFIPVMAIVLAALGITAYFYPANLLFAVPISALWLASPLIADAASRSKKITEASASLSQKRYLRKLACDTWLFFREHLRPEYNYLMPDNLQIVPSRVVAERTSPTNISLSMLSVQSAYDLGFIPWSLAIEKIGLITSTIVSMEKYRGHLFNWYAIRNLAPLNPRYISSVDSGNLLGHLYTLLSVYDDAASLPILSTVHFDSLQQLLEDLLAHKDLASDAPVRPLLNSLKEQLSVNTGADVVAHTTNLLGESTERLITELERLGGNDTPIALECRSLCAVLNDLSSIRPLLNWLIPLQELAASARTVQMRHDTSSDPLQSLLVLSVDTLSSLQQGRLSLASLETALTSLTAASQSVDRSALESAWLNPLDVLSASLKIASEWLVSIRNESSSTLENLQRIIAEMDFSFLYDNERNLFTIGYNAEHARRDPSYYDLLASEARLLSFIAVARGEVPQKHWFSLGRSLANTPGGKALISWSGTMFEYLMPFIVMRDFPTTILGRTGRAVVNAQIHYGARQSAPWGISESAYSGVDFEKTYQYRAFGVPGLGLKRGLSEDLVVSPYSTLLALSFAPSLNSALSNLRFLEAEGARGEFGFYEAIDYTTTRHVRTEGKHIVQSFFAHHQGMSLVSINNVLNGDIMCERFHDQPIVRSAELLLHERFPERVAAIVPHEPELATIHREEAELETTGLEIVTSPHTLAPRVRLLSNGRYSVLVDAAGGGFSLFDRSTMLTRWREDPTSSPFGTFVYIHDASKNILWSCSYHPTKREPDSYEAIFSPGRAEFKRFDDKVFTHTEITVAPEDDVELRRITVTNLGEKERELHIVSYTEPVLNAQRADSAHPAFNKLFVRAEPLPDSDAIICTRRPRSEHEQELFFLHRVTLRTSYAPIRFYTSRASFLGRNGSLQEPALFDVNSSTVQPLDGNVDPIAALGCTVRLEPGASETLVFISGATRSQRDAQTLIERYQDLMHVNRAFELSWSRAQVELRNHAYSSSQADLFHRLAGCLIYNEENVRAAPQTLSANKLSQSSLWRFGISGDLPILLIKISDSRQNRVLQEVLLAHHFLRERGLEFDLVVLHKNQGSYMQHLAEDIEYTVRLSPAGALIDRRGGVFLRSSSQISEAEGTLLETVARVVLDCDLGDLGELLGKGGFDQVSAPTPAKGISRTQRVFTPAPALMRANPLGGFLVNSNHYLLPKVGSKRPPLPWCNVVANPHFGFLVSESGGGYTWSENSRENRLTAWSNDPVLDPVSEVVYLRKADSGEYWSLTPHPAGDGLEYSVEHGFGYSSFSTNNGGIETTLSLTGSNKERVKWFSVTLSNNEAQEQRLELFLFCDVVLGVSKEDSYRFVTSSFDLTTQTLCAQNFYNNEFAGRVVATGCSEPIVSYTTSRLEFIGRNGDLSSPEILNRGGSSAFLATKTRGVKLSTKTGAGHDHCAALHVTVTLKPKEEKNIIFFLSEHSSMDSMRKEAPRYKSLQMQRVELQGVQLFWRDLLSSIEIQTPSESFNLMMNGWLLYQTVACRLFARSAFYQSGGALGFRDQLQDSLALLTIRPDLVRQQIITHAARQFKEGDVQHWWHPPTGRGVRTRISDDLLWLPYAVARYIETTGDYSILAEQVPFLQGAPLAEGQMETYFIPERSSEEGSILEHCLRTLRATEAVGPHGLPLMGAGDWNDGMNEIGRHGKGESVWLAWFQNEVINRFAPILETQGEQELATALRLRAQNLAAAAENEAWDGAWYRRAFYDDGTPVGSRENEECSIDSLCQSWAIISKAAQHERASQALQSAIEKLVDREGNLIKLLTPPFNKTDKNPGYIKGYPPGVRENGGQYTHAAAWLIIATALQGSGDTAFDLFDLINPINATATERGLDTYRAEPYVMCGDVYSEAPLRGRAGWSWYTGSAGWLYQAGVEYIMGLAVHPLHCTINPCIPQGWEHSVIRYRRGERIFIFEISNPDGVQTGVNKVEINGIESLDKRIPFEDPSYRGEVHVKVVMGNKPCVSDS